VSGPPANRRVGPDTGAASAAAVKTPTIEPNKAVVVGDA
jgi:hypothetical protein